MKLYHATYEDLIPSIEKKGLGGSGSGYEWEDSKKGAVYLANSYDVAVSYAEVNDDVPEDWLDNIVVFEVDSEALDQDRIHIDQNVQDNDGSTLEYHGIIPFNLLKIVDSDEDESEEVDESATTEHLMELMEDPNTIWEKTVHCFEYNDEDEINVNEVLASLQKDLVVADLEIKRVNMVDCNEEYDTVFTFKCLDPYAFEDTTNQAIWEFAKPVGRFSEDVDWNIVSPKRKDWEVVTMI